MSFTKEIRELPLETAFLHSTPGSEEKIQRLDRLARIGLLSASMAHEIKNSLAVVKVYADLLAQKNPNAELTNVVTHELQRINEMVTQILRFAAPKRTVFAPVKIHGLLDQSLRLLQHQISAKLIALERDYQAAQETIHGDEAQLQQVLMNLLLNAIEAMSANGTLTVATKNIEESGTRKLQIQIRDTGVGIAPENLPRLFEPFFTTKRNGTGLGLLISQRIVREHGGTIEAHSETGKGSTFSLIFPILPAA
ncbi:MAG TPA: ATP-binding protein [Verrucomicrobiae bacterium]|nr:ATP-binding protein [Verrucomicrobiae bacterium]